MRVRSVELREIRLPLVEPFRISSGSVSERRVLLAELAAADGTVAWSECVAGRAPNYSPETIDTAWWVLGEWLVERLLAESWESAADVRARLDEGVRGHRMAKATLEMGCWALEATARGESLAARLGGDRTEVATGISLGIQPTTEALVERARRAVAAGYRKVKLKIRPGADVEPVRAVRAAVGEKVVLTVDANAAYGLDDGATFEALDELGLAMIEQPLEWDDLAAHAELQRRLQTPICLDESITGVGRVEEMLALGSGRVVNIKPGRVGGLGASLAIHERCVEAGVPVWCGGMLESGVGRAYNVALASLPGFVHPGDLSPSARYWAEDVVEPEWTMSDDGLVTVPRSEPGLGVSVRHDRVDALTVRRRRFG
ncbi:MAG: o-succinylbenzoate synthase [Thermoanaerobaculia bacterium]|nr:o-succinylbenzoate synthase [Thermoanaerobaculia bacterium]